jgi:choline transport protein
MSPKNHLENIIPSTSPPDSILGHKSVDNDALKLAEMGYTQDLQRNFSVWSVLGVGFFLTNSRFAISAALITGINSGEPLLLIYGIIAVSLISVYVGVSLSGLASAFPECWRPVFLD